MTKSLNWSARNILININEILNKDIKRRLRKKLYGNFAESKIPLAH